VKNIGLQGVGGLLVLLALLSVSSATPAAPFGQSDEAATAYRAGDYSRAAELWSSALEADGLPAAERARLYHNQGNAAWRRGRVAEAAGWYSASLRLRPRSADTWANLELARASAGWDPQDSGDLRDTLGRVCTSLTASEADGAALLGLVLLALALLGEALRGGVGWRRASYAAVLLLAMSSAWAYGSRLREVPGECLVTSDDGASLRSEPRREAISLGRLDPGTRAVIVDELPNWVRLRVDDAPASWVERAKIFHLDSSSQ
jgi:tetratricopeptide (TPR) repeat protein